MSLPQFSGQYFDRDAAILKQKKEADEYGPGHGRDRNRRERRTNMVRVTIEVKGRTDSRRVRITAPSVERALEMAGAGRPGRRVRMIFCKDAGAFEGQTLTETSPPTALERIA
jgi:hypothetical protein